MNLRFQVEKEDLAFSRGQMTYTSFCLFVSSKEVCRDSPEAAYNRAALFPTVYDIPPACFIAAAAIRPTLSKSSTSGGTRLA